ncbi:MAG TPA: ComEC/Rec2 family competence protein [Elusimicrobiales bacterium]|nr:ComEC/Rec2 family competence protein [Elusimicrobiales bacterium]
MAGTATRKVTAFLFLLLLSSADLRAQLNVYFVNVGQGDAVYIELPGGRNALIDGGPSGKPIYDFLKAKGVTSIDHVVLTHPHMDHFRGLRKVFTALNVKNFYDTRAENKEAAGDNELRKLAAAEPGCITRFPRAGEDLAWDPQVAVKVVSSCSSPVTTRNNVETNNCSLVLRLFYNGNGLLFMGDAESAVEDALLKNFKPELAASILKVAHHGSRYTSTAAFLKRVQPKYAFISVGRDNVYGHPHKEALDRLLAAGAKLFLTTDGTQRVTIPAPAAGERSPGAPLINRGK